MKFPALGAFLRFPQLTLLMALFFSAPAWAQFEIAPDHFDANTTADKKQPAKAKPVQSANQAASLSAKTGEKHQGISQTAAANGNHQAASVNAAAGKHSGNGQNPESSGKTATSTARRRTATKKVTLASTR